MVNPATPALSLSALNVRTIKLPNDYNVHGNKSDSGWIVQSLFQRADGTRGPIKYLVIFGLLTENYDVNLPLMSKKKTKENGQIHDKRELEREGKQIVNDIDAIFSRKDSTKFPSKKKKKEESTSTPVESFAANKASKNDSTAVEYRALATTVHHSAYGSLEAVQKDEFADIRGTKKRTPHSSSR